MVSIFTGQKDVVPVKVLKEAKKEIKNKGKANFLAFPERLFYHPETVMTFVLNYCEDHYEEEIIIVTYCDYVLNAVRLHVYEHNRVGLAKIYVFLNNNTTDVVFITAKGGLSDWIPEVFDAYEVAHDLLED